MAYHNYYIPYTGDIYRPIYTIVAKRMKPSVSVN